MQPLSIKNLISRTTVTAVILLSSGSFATLLPNLQQAVAAPDPCQKYYGKGYCTDYIRTKFSIPWKGHASSWLSQAKNYGWKTGSASEPKPGAVAVWTSGYGHVAIVESVAKDKKSFTISEWNYGALKDKDCSVTVNFGVTKSRTILLKDNTASGFIYGK